MDQLEVYFARKWRRVSFDGESYFLALPDNSPVFIGIVIGQEAMYRRCDAGTARFVPGPEPPSIAVDDPVVAEMFACSGIDYTRTRA
jgi:hypothetical protein